MTADQALAFVLFAVVAAGTPGPSNIILAATGANVGVRRGLPCLFGVAGGMGFMLFAVALGPGSLIVAHPFVRQGLRWSGAVFLLWLAWKIATARRGEAAAGSDVVGFWRAAAFQWANPKSWLVGAGAVATFLPAAGAGSLWRAASFALLFVVAAVPSCFVWLAFGASVQRWLRTDRAWRAFNRAMGLLLAASIALLVR